MNDSRRTVLARFVQVLLGATGATAGVVFGHRMLGDRKTADEQTYPAKTPEYPMPGRRLIRPPGAVEEDAFLAGCIRCYRCQDACEPGAIRFFTEADGKHYYTPYIDPTLIACNLCDGQGMKCTQVCPTGVLVPMTIEQKAEVAMGSVELDKDRCLSYKAKRIRDEQALLMMMGESPTESEAIVQRRGPCGECFMFCPRRRHAIQMEPGAFLAPNIFPDECIGCGMCEEICCQLVRGEPAIRVVATRGEVG